MRGNELGAPYAKLAESCGWSSDKGSPAKSKVSRLLESLQRAGLADKSRGEWTLTNTGKATAEKASRSMPIGTMPE